MKFLTLSSFFILLFACSTTKQLNNKWIGKTDQEVVTEFGLPTEILIDTLNGKIYKYGYTISDSVKNYIVRTKIVKYGEATENYPGKYSITIFHFDSLGILRKIDIQQQSKTVINGIEL